MEELPFYVPGMTCDHCVAAVRGEIEKIPGVEAVVVDLDTKAVVATGVDVDQAAVWSAVDEAGYEAVALPASGLKRRPVVVRRSSWTTNTP
jgi:copper chaperone